jgi:hypothetical protein
MSTEQDILADSNCLECKYYDLEGVAGEMCAFEGAMMIDMVSPVLAQMFGWAQTETEYGPRDGWEEPEQCAFFAARSDDDGERTPRPKPICPATLSLFADQRTTLDIVAPVGKTKRNATTGASNVR